MKFVSKSANLLIVLRPGLSAQPITGTPAKPTVSVRFKDGLAEVQQPELIEMMLAHPGFNGDFISADVDPYTASRQSSEPAHVLTDLKFGTPVSRAVVGGNPLAALPLEQQKALMNMATELAKSMMPSMLESALKGLVSAHEADKKNAGLTKTGKPKGRPGRKPKAKVAEVPSVAASTEDPRTQAAVS